MKTLDEYVLNELENTKNELALVRKVNEELKAKIDEMLNKQTIDDIAEEDLPKSKVYTVSEQPNFYYSVHYEDDYYLNDLLKKYNKTPEYLKRVLNGEEDFEEYCNLKGKYGDAVGKVEQSTYDFLMVNFYGNKALFYTDYNKQIGIINLNNSQYFLSPEKAKEYMVEKVKQQIKEYFACKRDEKFEPNEEKEKQE